VRRFDVFYDVVHEPIDAGEHAAFLAALRPQLARGDVFAWTRADLAPLVERVRAASAGAAAGDCAADEGDLTALEQRLADCRSIGRWLCQSALNAVCVAAAKARGDEWVGLFDVDEFLFVPGRPGREEACTWGGAEGRLPPAVGASAAECVLPLAEAPLRTGRDLLSTLRARYSHQLVSSVVVEGVVFGVEGSGPNSTGPREGLLTRAHARTAAYSADGVLVPPLGYSNSDCPPWFCGSATPKKSFIRVKHAPVAGVRIHHHDTGPFARELPVPGANLKLNHYAFDDIPSLMRRGRSDIAANNKLAPGDRLGVADFMSASSDESARALLPLLEHCMRAENADAAECHAADERGAF
jgi:hypothetical protein